MKTKILGALVAGFVILTGIPQAGAEEKLEPGKDRIDVPAIGPGLCLHNLFQSGMVLQRDKPIRIWGWAEPGENVIVTFGEKTQSSTAASDWTNKRGYPFGAVIVNNTPERFRGALLRAKELTLKRPPKERIITINSWNEWGEGSYLEPDTVHGMKYLEAVREVFGTSVTKQKPDGKR